MASIKGTSKILLQPGTTKYALSIEVTVCSSATANDGFIPYGTVVSSVTAKVYDEDGVDVSSEMITIGATVTDNVVSIGLSYPSTSGPGLYKLTIIATLSSGATMEIDYNRIQALDY